MEERQCFLCTGHLQDHYGITAPSSDICTLQRVLQDDTGKEKSKNDAKNLPYSETFEKHILIHVCKLCPCMNSLLAL